VPVFESLHNFRDVGGCPTIDGRTVATGRLYRSDVLVNLTAAEQAQFDRLGIRTVIDLRRTTEVELLGRIADAHGRRYLNIPPEHAPWEERPYDPADEPPRYLADRYLELADTGRHGIGRVISVLADRDAAPSVVHCYAGKDRTGVVMAITLALLGVPDEAIGDDYARSDYWERTAPPSHIPVLWTLAPPSAITVFLAELREEYGSVERYATTAGVTDAEIKALRDHMLR
jgi:protein tyrosine/serine phosphatase